MPDSTAAGKPSEPHKPGAGGMSAPVWLWICLLVLVAVATGVAVPLLTAHRAPQPQPQARQYLNLSACLLTDPGGIVPGTPAAPIWTAMQSASIATRVMVSYLPDTGPSDVSPMLNTLAERKCGLIITTAAAAGRAASAARTYPHQQFLIIAPGGAATIPPNAVLVPPAAAPVRIAQAIRALSGRA
jgi:hypothetical protein